MVDMFNTGQPVLKLTKHVVQPDDPMPVESVRALARVFWCMNNYQEPDPNGPLGEGWRWLLSKL